MSDKQAYIAEIENQLEYWDQEIYKFRVITEEIGEEEPDRQIKYYQLIESIVARKNDVAKKLSELQESENLDLQQAKLEIEKLREHVTNGIESARSVVN